MLVLGPIPWFYSISAHKVFGRGTRLAVTVSRSGKEDAMKQRRTKSIVAATLFTLMVTASWGCAYYDHDDYPYRYGRNDRYERDREWRRNRYDRDDRYYDRDNWRSDGDRDWRYSRRDERDHYDD
jgi:hypothetical protein